MIEKLNNGNTLITLGNGTVYAGNVSSEEEDKPFGIYFSNEPNKSEDAVIIAIPHKKAIASYVMALVRFLDEYTDEFDDETFSEALEGLKKDLEPLLPKNK